MSSGAKYTACPPSCVMPTSNDSRVRKLDLSKIIAMLLLRSGDVVSIGCCLSLIADWINAWSSSVESSPIESKCLLAMVILYHCLGGDRRLAPRQMRLYILARRRKKITIVSNILG